MNATRPPIGMNCLRTPAREHDFEPLLPDTGHVPKALDGTFYRVGPGKFEDANGPFAHWFDGEGLLSAIRVGDGRAAAACRMIRPAGADGPDYAKLGRMGRAPQGLVRRMRGFVDPSVYVNVANTALMEWQGRLFALFEACLPTEVDPETLETIGEVDFGVVARALGAHPQLHAASGSLINQGFVPPPKGAIDYYAFPSVGSPKRTHRVPISGRFPAHDLAVTESDIITVLSPLFIDIVGVVSGRPIADCLRWRPEKGTEIVVSPVGGGRSCRLQTPAMLYSHTANAFDDGDLRIVHGVAAADSSLADWTARVRRGCADLQPLPAPGRLTELRIDPGTGLVEVNALFETPTEFPTIDPRWSGKRHSVIYGTTYMEEAQAYADLSDAIVRFDLQRSEVTKLGFGEGHVVSEPVFIPSDDTEGEGWLMSVNYDALNDRSYLAIVRASRTMELVATLSLSAPLPMSLHGLWVARK